MEVWNACESEFSCRIKRRIQSRRGHRNRAASAQEPGGNSGKQIRELPLRSGKLAHLQTPSPPICKPYLSIAELARLTPWTDQAIRTMLSKGMLREGVQFFYVGRRPIFKWAAIVAFIEHAQTTNPVPHYRDQIVHGAKA